MTWYLPFSRRGERGTSWTTNREQEEKERERERERERDGRKLHGAHMKRVARARAGPGVDDVSMAVQDVLRELPSCAGGGGALCQREQTHNCAPREAVCQ